MRDPYEALGVARDATAAEIKKAYRRLTVRFHPDRNPGRGWAAERYVEVTAAYEILRDPHCRAMFDATLPPPRRTKAASSTPAEPIDPDPIIEDLELPRNDWSHWVRGLLGY